MEQRIIVKSGYDSRIVMAEVTDKRWGNGGRTLYGTVVIDGKERIVWLLRGRTWECGK